MSCENYSLPEKQVKSKPKIQQTLDFERPALVDAMEFLQASQIPKPGTEQQFTTFAHTQLRPRTAHRPPATLHTWHKSWTNMWRLNIYTQTHHISLTRSKNWKVSSNIARNSNSLLKRFLTRVKALEG